jgi:pyruvate formate lyase activating enzyme
METPVYFRKTSLVDYPSKVAAAVFFPFCNMRCPWCHNGDLITEDKTRRDSSPLISLGEALSHIKKRAGVLDGVVLSGGEPTLFSGLPELIREIKKSPLCVKLDTNGALPKTLELLLSSDFPPDYIAMDLKFAPRRYSGLLRAQDGADSAPETILESVRIIRAAYDEGRIQAEFRSLVFPHGEFSERDMDEFAPFVGDVPWQFRAFRPGSCLDLSWNEYGETPPEKVERFRDLWAGKSVNFSGLAQA